MNDKKKGKKRTPMEGMPGPMRMIGKMMGGMMGEAEDTAEKAVETSEGAETETSVETPLEVLKRRYASGEITEEQFLEMKEALSD